MFIRPDFLSGADRLAENRPWLRVIVYFGQIDAVEIDTIQLILHTGVILAGEVRHRIRFFPGTHDEIDSAPVFNDDTAFRTRFDDFTRFKCLMILFADLTHLKLIFGEAGLGGFNRHTLEIRHGHSRHLFLARQHHIDDQAAGCEQEQ